jgi:hypothetical protein
VQLRIGPLGVKLTAVFLAHHLSRVIANDDPGLNPIASLLSLPFALLLYGVPLAIYVLAVRTWPGTVIAGLGWIVVEVLVARHVATAPPGGPGLLLMPPYLVLTTATVALGERVAPARRRRRPR